ncbi:MAG: OmpA family protein [Bacteroidota bacterium]
MKRISFLPFLLLPFYSIAQTDFEFLPIVELSREVNSKSDELMPILSGDGTRLYFTRQAHEENIGGRFFGQDIWYATYIEGAWKKVRKFDQFNNQGNNVIVGEDMDHRIYLLNSYEDNYGGKSGLSYSDPSNEGWTSPAVTKIQGVYNREDNQLYGLKVNKRSDVLLISMKGPNTLGYEDLYVSFKFTGWNRFFQSPGKGEDEFYWWSTPIHLGNTINSDGYDISPYLSNDGKVLFFASNRAGGYGSADIYYSERLDDTWQNWSKPVNLGRRINSPRFDAYFILTDDSTAYFSSARSGGFSNIYSSKLVKSSKPILVDRKHTYDYKISVEQVIINEPVAIIPRIETQEQLDSLNQLERNILFDHNSANLLLKDQDLLENCLDILVQNPALSIHLIGHTDHIGDVESNNQLSLARAKSVRDYLIVNGVKSSAIYIDALGEDIPIYDNTTKEGREQNRRVEIVFAQSDY